MFIIKSDALKSVVSMLVKSARKAGIGDKTIYIRTLDDGLVSFYYHAIEISVEKKVSAEIHGNLEVATSIGELDVKVTALPDEIEVTVEKTSGGPVQFTWGGSGKRRSCLKLDVLPETSPMVEVPPFEEIVNWKPGELHNLVRHIPPFTLDSKSPKADQLSNTLGPNFSKDDTGRVIIRATDGVKGVIMYPKQMEWFDDTMSIHISALQGVADVIPSDARIQVGLSGGTVVIFKAGYTTAVCRTLVGKFPPIAQLFKTKTKGKMNIDRLELIKLCERVRRLAPTYPVVQFYVEGNKVSAVISGVLEQALPASVDGEVPSFAVMANHLEKAAQLFEMSRSADELTLYVNAFNEAVSIAHDGNEDIRLWVLPYTSQFIKGINNTSSKRIPTTV
ncbi:hypothetical protein [Paenibacillus oralis]|uniref:hypothetical protein n=1 Tax=Paenibacillus oralis TaxID=2490856 RepID=UPI0015A954F7|nr:hypothetical protein [Paenibacillus oralis]